MTTLQFIFVYAVDWMAIPHPATSVVFAIVFLAALSAAGWKTTIAIAPVAAAALAVTGYLFVRWPMTLGPFSVKSAFSPGIALLPVTLGLCLGAACRAWQLRTARRRFDMISIGIAVAGTAILAVVGNPWIDLYAAG